MDRPGGPPARTALPLSAPLRAAGAGSGAGGGAATGPGNSVRRARSARGLVSPRLVELGGLRLQALVAVPGEALRLVGEAEHPRGLIVRDRVLHEADQAGRAVLLHERPRRERHEPRLDEREVLVVGLALVQG